MPSFSPDGRRLAFCRVSNLGTCDIYLAHFAQDLRPSGHFTQLTSENHHIAGLDFTADGREIIFSSDRAGKFALWRIPASAGGPPQPLTIGGEGAMYPQLSRRAGRLTYVRQTFGGTIRRLPVSGSAKSGAQGEAFLSSSRNENTPRFSPDGRRAAFASDRSGSSEIWLASADGCNAVQLTSFGQSADALDPTWSPSSDRVTFDSFSSATNEVEIYWMTVSGGQPQRLTKGTFPFWSRDGNWIYFTSEYPSSPQIWKISPAGGRPVQVTKNGGVLPTESPDGKFLYFSRYALGHSLWRIPVEGGEEAHVLDIQGGWSMSYTLAGEDIYYFANTLTGPVSPNGDIESFRPATGAPNVITC